MMSLAIKLSIVLLLVTTCCARDHVTEARADRGFQQTRPEPSVPPTPETKKSAELRRLVFSFERETLIRLPGPPGYSTSTSRALVAYGKGATPYLIEGLSNPDANIRRHSSFALAQIADRSAFDPLRRAAQTEFQRVEHRQGDTDPRSVSAPLDMMVIALAKIEPKEAVAWLVTLPDTDVRQVYRELAIIVSDPPVCGADPVRLCRERLDKWWSNNKNADPKQLLRPQPWLAH